jgi:hypothetical protein
MLEQIYDCSKSPCFDDQNMPYVVQDSNPPEAVARAPCVGTPCVLETSISLLPGNLQLDASSATELLKLEASNMKGLNDSMDYLQNPLSHGVDGNPATTFCAFQGMVIAEHGRRNVD